MKAIVDLGKACKQVTVIAAAGNEFLDARMNLPVVAEVLLLMDQGDTYSSSHATHAHT